MKRKPMITITLLLVLLSLAASSCYMGYYGPGPYRGGGRYGGGYGGGGYHHHHHHGYGHGYRR